MNLPKYSRGFTLLELLISISIIGIIAGGIIPSFSAYIKNQNLQQAFEQVKSELRTVQNKALTGALSDYQIPPASGNYAEYWGLIFSGDSGASASYFVSVTNTTCPPAAIQNQGSFSIPNDILYYNSNGTQCIFFSIKNGDISTIPSSTALNLNFQTKRDGDVGKTIEFNSYGLIH